MNASALAPPLSFCITILYNLEHSEYGGVERDRERERQKLLPAASYQSHFFLSFFLSNVEEKEGAPSLSFSPFFLFFPSFISETVRLKIISILLSFFGTLASGYINYILSY